MKSHIRVLGIDDGPFEFEDRDVPIVGVVMRLPSYIEGIMLKKVTVDGEDATSAIESMVRSSRFGKGLHAILLDGATLGGFNVVDIFSLNESLGVPVITVTRDQPDLSEIKNALKSHFPTWEGRYDLLTKGEIHRVETGYNPVFVKCAGLSVLEAERILHQATVQGVIPEAIRVAHLVATAIVRGESGSKA